MLREINEILKGTLAPINSMHVDPIINLIDSYEQDLYKNLEEDQPVEIMLYFTNPDDDNKTISFMRYYITNGAKLLLISIAHTSLLMVHVVPVAALP
jgi:hypothetical protein